MPDPTEPATFRTAADFERWLAKHHGTHSEIWLCLARRGNPVATVTYAEALDVALCHGWIDGQKRSLDAQHWLQRFTPRSARSRWSQVNCGKAEALIAAGRMRPAGQAEVDRARADGRWAAAYAGSRTITVPDDLTAALADRPAARDRFERLDRRNRYAILYRIHDAKRPETRARRIAQFVERLAKGESIYE